MAFCAAYVSLCVCVHAVRWEFLSRSLFFSPFFTQFLFHENLLAQLIKTTNAPSIESEKAKRKRQFE